MEPEEFTLFLSEIENNSISQDEYLRKLALCNFIQKPHAQKARSKALAANTGIVVPSGPVPPGLAREPLLGFNNEEYNWLTYETLFNQRPYRKTNQRCEMGLYRIPLKNIKIFLRDDVDQDVLKQLADAFFPDLDPNLVLALSNADWPWKKKLPDLCNPQSPALVVANRSQNILYLKQFAILPFNAEDNDQTSDAIGKKSPTGWGLQLTKLRPAPDMSWGFWKTASRSCVVKVKRVKNKNARWQDLLGLSLWESWDYTKEDPPSAEVLKRAETVELYQSYMGVKERGAVLSTEAQRGQAFRLSDVRDCFSIKTGVRWVGNVDQKGKHKDKLEENSIVACLRSDLIIAFDRQAGRNQKADKDISIQTELLSITERDMIRADGKEAFGDGIQVRDLSVLSPDKIYFPPLSIPFVGLDLKSLKRRYDGVNDPAWCELWKKCYAERLGRAKAMLLLRYGLQMGSPNAQNFLIEFNRPSGADGTPTPTGKFVFRDVGDMYLHREVLWARLGGVGLPPQEIDERTRLRELNSKIIKFECEDLAHVYSYYPQETGSLYEIEYGPRGTRFLWHRFSTLSKGSSVENPSPIGTDPDAYSRGWPLVLRTMCDWGLAHNRSYVNYLSTTLGLDFGINWDEAPQPDRYTALSEIDVQRADQYYKADLKWEEQAADKVHNILKRQEGQDAIKRHLV